MLVLMVWKSIILLLTNHYTMLLSNSYIITIVRYFLDYMMIFYFYLIYFKFFFKFFISYSVPPMHLAYVFQFPHLFFCSAVLSQAFIKCSRKAYVCVYIHSMYNIHILENLGIFA